MVGQRLLLPRRKLRYFASSSPDDEPALSPMIFSFANHSPAIYLFLLRYFAARAILLLRWIAISAEYVQQHAAVSHLAGPHSHCLQGARLSDSISVAFPKIDEHFRHLSSPGNACRQRRCCFIALDRLSISLMLSFLEHYYRRATLLASTHARCLLRADGIFHMPLDFRFSALLTLP